MKHDERYYSKALQIIYNWKKSWRMGSPKSIGGIIEEDELAMLIVKALMDEADKKRTSIG